MGGFDGARALVTGGGSGIGAAAARALVDAGAQVTVTDVDAATVSAVADEIGGRAAALDVADPAAWREVVADDPYDIAVLNAGVGARFDDLRTLDDELLHRVMAVNVEGVILGTREMLRVMAGRGGRISVTASVAGLAVHTQSPVYAASKWAVVGWVRAIAPSLHEHGVAINAICPGLVDTPILGPGGGDRMRAMGLQVLDAEEVAAAHLDVLASGGTGRVLAVQRQHGVTEHEFNPVIGYQG
jgi:NAD(P)-dependent dehydrogenase (short-subunit alcohol dehydrogenase family)